MWARSVRASHLERTCGLPGDGLIPEPIVTLTHAITIRRPAREVWPWLAQMGAGNRAGWYSYDVIDNGRRRSAARIVEELQRIGVGTLFPAGSFHHAAEATPGHRAPRRVATDQGHQHHAFGGGMSGVHGVARVMRWTAGGLGLLAVGYATVAGTTWYRYGRVPSASPDERDPLLDQFMPEYEVAERHHVRVAAPAAMTLSAVADTDLRQSTIVRVIFRARELVLGAEPDAETRPKGLLAQMTSLGWRVLAETPGREIVVGAVTQPWLPNVVFRGLAPEEFRAFQEPGYVKIVWTLRADPVGESESMFRTETRVTTTDQTARTKFRWYWARFSPGIVLIRRGMLGLLKTDAERRALGRH